MEFNTKLSKLIARRKVIETRKRLNKIVQSPFEINNTLKTVYQNNVVDNNKKYIITRQDYCRDFIKEYNKYYENVDVIINDKGKVILIVYMIKLKLTLLLILYFIMIVKIKLKFQYRL